MAPRKKSSTATSTPAAVRKQTYKKDVIAAIFNDRFDPSTKTLSDPIVTLDQVVDAIHAYNAAGPNRNQSTKYPSNFFKDIVRRIDNANKIWPPSVFAKGYTGSQLTGDGRCFEFIEYPVGSKTPFVKIEPSASTIEFVVSTLGIPTLARALSRTDETWLMQVAARLNLIETHLARTTHDKVEYVELLQLGIKQSRAEIDGLYMAYGADKSNLLISVEAKTTDDIYSGQIAAQVAAVRKMKNVVNSKATIDRIIPMAIKRVAPSKIFVVQFNSMKMDEDSTPRLTVVAESLMVLKPALSPL